MWRRQYDRELVDRLGPGEQVLARGRSGEVPKVDSSITGGANTYLLLTPERLLWTRFPRAHVAVLPLRAITSFQEGRQYHRYILRLRHEPIERLEGEPAHRFVWWAWGRTTVLRRRGETALVFSRPDTDLARALRAELTRLAVPAEEPFEVPAPPRSRRDGKVLLRRSRR